MDEQDLSMLAEKVEESVREMVKKMIDNADLEGDCTVKRDNERVNCGKDDASCDLRLPEVMASKREQSGFFHIWFRGCNRYNVFYDYEDFTHFLLCCTSAANKHKTAVTAFVLMDNHVHLQVYTNTLSLFMTSLLISFNRWYNKRWNLSGRVFGGPFSSCTLHSRDALESNYLYILTNPVRAGICIETKDYKWSSYHFLKKGFYNPLATFIGLNMMVSDYLFGNIKLLKKRLIEYLQDSIDMEEDFGDIVDGADEGGLAADKAVYEVNAYKQYWCATHPTDNEVARHYMYLLKGRSTEELEKSEFVKILRLLKSQSNASYRQISSVTHESYAYILRILKSNG